MLTKHTTLSTGYPVDSVIHPSNNWGLVNFEFVSSVAVACERRRISGCRLSPPKIRLRSQAVLLLFATSLSRETLEMHFNRAYDISQRGCEGTRCIAEKELWNQAYPLGYPP